MHGEFTAVVKHSGDWWIGWIEEIPGVNCQEATRDELLDTLAVTLREVLETQPPGRPRRSRGAVCGGDHSLVKRRRLIEQSAIPRHAEIDNTLARRICRDLGVPPIP